MTLPAFMLALRVLTFTWPGYSAGPDTCGPGLLPLQDLSHAVFYKHTVSAGVETLAVVDGLGKEGQPDSLEAEDPALERAVVWAIACDLAGNCSCAGNKVEWNAPGTVAVLPPPVKGLRLEPVRPSPVSSQATIAWQLPQAGDCRVAVHDVTGRRVAVLASGRMEAGRHERTWSPGTRRAGLYFVRLQFGFERPLMQRFAVMR